MNVKWRVDQFQATYEDAIWNIHYDARRPQNGLTVRSSLVARTELLAIDLPGATAEETVTEIYARGSDLVIGYEQHRSRSVRPEFYYRVQQATADTLAVQLIASVETSLLESAPTTFVRSKLETGTLMQRGRDGDWISEADTQTAAVVGCVQRPAEADISFFQFVHPSDYCRAFSDAETGSAGFALFPDSLEKGVIRRGRVLAGFVPREDDLQRASECFDQLLNEAPPLTT